MAGKISKSLTKKDLQFLSSLDRLPSVHIVKKKLVLIFKRRLPSGNKLASHWGANNSYKKAYLNDLIKLNEENPLIGIVSPPVNLTAYRFSPGSLDITNETIKPLEDALKEFGLIPDDTKKYVKRITIKEVKSKEKKTVLIVEGDDEALQKCCICGTRHGVEVPICLICREEGRKRCC